MKQKRQEKNEKTEHTETKGGKKKKTGNALTQKTKLLQKHTRIASPLAKRVSSPLLFTEDF